MARIVCVLYPDPERGHPTSCARDSLPAITACPDGQTTPTPTAIDFAPGELMEADVVISQPFRPACITRECMEKAPRPAPADHPWRTMPHNGTPPHTSGTSLSAQARYAAGTREILECFLGGKPIRSEYLIVDGGSFAGTGAHSYAVA